MVSILWKYSEDGEAWDAFCQMKATYKCIYAMVNSLKGYMPYSP